MKYVVLLTIAKNRVYFVYLLFIKVKNMHKDNCLISRSAYFKS